MAPDTAAPSTRVEQVRVDGLRPGDLLLASSRSVVSNPGQSRRRRHIEIVIRTADGDNRLMVWRADTLVFVLRVVEAPPRADIDGITGNCLPAGRATIGPVPRLRGRKGKAI